MMIKLRKTGPRSTCLYAWSTGKRWYPINRKSMRFEADLKLQQNLFNALLQGLVATAKGTYDRTQKKLSLRL